jgi:hypothetical protein
MGGRVDPRIKSGIKSGDGHDRRRMEFLENNSHRDKSQKSHCRKSEPKVKFDDGHFCSSASARPLSASSSPRAARRRRLKKSFSIFPRNPLISHDSDERIQGNPIAGIGRLRAQPRPAKTIQTRPKPAAPTGRPRAAALPDGQALGLARPPEAAPARPYFARIASSSSATMLVILIAGLTAGPAVSL